MAAIHARGLTGKGQVVDVALYGRPSRRWNHRCAREKLGVVPMREGLQPALDGAQQLPTPPRRRLGADRDNSQPTWRRLVALMQQPELLTDPRFETIRARGKPENMKTIDAPSSPTGPRFRRRAAGTLLREGEVPTTRVWQISADIYADPHFAARDAAQVPHRCWATPRRPAWCRACRPRRRRRRTGPDRGRHPPPAGRRTGADTDAWTNWPQPAPQRPADERWNVVNPHPNPTPCRRTR